MNSITIIGTGAYGLSIALNLLKNNQKVKMWVESKERAEYLNNNRNNSGILPNIKIPKEIEFSNDYEYVLKNSKIILIVVATKFVGPVAQEISKYDIKNKHFCILSKGI